MSLYFIPSMHSAHPAFQLHSSTSSLVSKKTNPSVDTFIYRIKRSTMEYMGAGSEGEWSSLSGMYTAEEADFMARLLENCPYSSMPGMTVQDAYCQGNGESTLHMSGNYEGSHYSLETTNSNFIPSSNESYYLSQSHPMLVTNNITNSSLSIDFGMGDVKSINTYLNDGDDHGHCSNQETSKGNIEVSDGSRPEAVNLEKKSQNKLPKITSLKRSQSSNNVQGTKRNVKAKNNLQVRTSYSEEDGNAGLNRQSSSSCCSEDDSIACKDVSGGLSPTSSLSTKDAAIPDSNGKSRARRGSASDPQSLYARKRREKINERLRVLQNLVPNGTKVDISTMLEEAVHYVKFLQLQIKLLSSDDMWMYAPICYNGMDLGLDRKVTTSSQP